MPLFFPGAFFIMQQQELIPHLFRIEFRKIVAVLVKHFGIGHIEMAEDIAGETFLAAMETWPYKGIPENPVAWLYTVAKNKTKNQLQRNQLFEGKIQPWLKHDANAVLLPEIDLSEKNITDSTLQMLFAVCHPSISAEAQITLSLRVLCGFGIDEIATAFLTNKETINKRLSRAKEKLQQEKIAIEFPPEKEISIRLETVLTTLYLLYSEGYYSESRDPVLREDLCLEAMRLTLLLIKNEVTNRPQVNALYALMCFHSSRFAARKSNSAGMIMYHEQDETLWDQQLIATGAYHLQLASTGTILSKYHLEASIAWWHTNKTDSKEKWDNILHLYNHLLQIAYSPVAALNRTFAFSKVHGNAAGIVEAEQLHLNNNPFYFTLLGELYKGIDNKKAISHFENAYLLAKTATDKQIIQKQMAEL